MPRAHDRRRSGETEESRPHHPSIAPSPRENEELESLRKAVGNAGMARLLDPATAREIESQRGHGKALQGSVGTDGAGVRMHDDATSAQLAKRIGAVAFTYGRDIFLASDAPAPDSPEGRAMLRHELTHVEQQGGDAKGAPKRISSPNSPAERDAHAAGAREAASPTNSAAPSSVQRQEEEEEELQMLPASDTVQRQEEEEELAVEEAGDFATAGEPDAEAVAAPANPAAAALFEATVTQMIFEASEAMGSKPPRSHEALVAMEGVKRGMAALSTTYIDSDPALAAKLHWAERTAIMLTNQISPLAYGGRHIDSIGANFKILMDLVEKIGPTLR